MVETTEKINADGYTVKDVVDRTSKVHVRTYYTVNKKKVTKQQWKMYRRKNTKPDNLYN
jgi:hypothetical protein